MERVKGVGGAVDESLPKRTDTSEGGATSSQVISSTVAVVSVDALVGVGLRNSLEIGVPSHRGHSQSGHTSSGRVVVVQEESAIGSCRGGL